MDHQQEDKGVAELAQTALQANKEHLLALQLYTQRLEAELETFDKLLGAVDAAGESDLDVGSFVTIPGSVKATTPVATKDLLSPESPFHRDALKRSRYQSFTEVHPMKPKELEALAEAVGAESYRQHALETQKSGCSTFPDINVQTTHILGLNAEGIDWDRVAEKVSAISSTIRTAKECEIRWVGDQHPEINHEPWSKEEVLKVKSLAAEFTDGRPDWETIAERLGTRRTQLDCMRHATPRKVHQWTAGADERLRKAIRMYGHDNWHLVACYVSEDATPSQCSHRFRALDESIKRTNWSPEEDARLSAAVAAYGSSWVDVAANVPGRHSDQCRERWTEQLNPSINKSQWSEEEDKTMLDYVREHKDASWKEISECLGNGRTQGMCRNRYAALQKGINSGLTVPTVNGETQVTSVDPTTVSSDLVSARSKTDRFKPFSNIPPDPTAPLPLQTEYQQPSHVVFLEPVVSSNPGSRSSRRTRSKTTTSNIPPPRSMTMPPSKKRKTRVRSAKANEPLTGAQQGSTDPSSERHPSN